MNIATPLSKKISAIIIYFISLILYVLFSMKGHGNIYVGLIIGEVGLIFIPTIFFIFIFKLNFKTDIPLKFPSVNNLIITILIVFPLLVIVYFLTQLIGNFVNIPPAYEIFFMQLVFFDNASWMLIIFTIAFIPAFVEEIFFRGFLLSMFDSQKGFSSIVFTAILFAFFHLDPYRFIQIFLIGILLGVFYKHSKSFFITFLLHFMINFITILSANLPDYMANYFMPCKTQMMAMFISTLFFTFLLYLFMKKNIPFSKNKRKEIL